MTNRLEPWAQLAGDKVVLITGASSGIGRDLCLDLAGIGCRIVAAARRVDRLESLCNEINRIGSGAPRAAAVELDVCADGAAVEAAVGRAWDAFGTVDVLINNAGVRGSVNSSLKLSEEEWTSTVKTNLTGSWLVSKYVCLRICVTPTIVYICPTGKSIQIYQTLIVRICPQSLMASEDQEILHSFLFFKVYKDGRVVKDHWPPVKIPPSDDPDTGIKSVDAVVNPDVSVRIFLPLVPDPTHKFPVLLYIHGGGFSMNSTASPVYDSQCKWIASKCRAMVVSVEYRLAPENPIPACYDDSWAALQWVAAHCDGQGPDPWINCHADFHRLFIGGDSAGGNITHNLVYRVASVGLPGVRVVGAILVHPYFGGVEADDRMWMYMCPNNTGFDDPRMRPSVEHLAVIGCERVLVFVAEHDHLCGPGKAYYERLKESGWRGTAELVVNEGVGHCFHLGKPKAEKSLEIVSKIADFIHKE